MLNSQRYQLLASWFSGLFGLRRIGFLDLAGATARPLCELSRSLAQCLIHSGRRTVGGSLMEEKWDRVFLNVNRFFGFMATLVLVGLAANLYLTNSAHDEVISEPLAAEASVFRARVPEVQGELMFRAFLVSDPVCVETSDDCLMCESSREAAKLCWKNVVD
jgi:hypothetical protein